MPRKKKRRAKPKDEHTHLTIRVDRYDVDLEAAVNRHAYEPYYAFSNPHNEPLYEFGARLRITGTSTYPENRAGDKYEITIYGRANGVVDLDLKLRDVQKRSDKGLPESRTYRGKQIPVYDPPSGIGYIQAGRGEQPWGAWVWAKLPFVNGLVALLGTDRQLFLTVHEYKYKRERSVRSLALKTVDPTEEQE